MVWSEDFINRVHCADALEFLKQIPDESIHCCITSPPYYGLRDYKIEPRIWGGDKDCRHEWIKDAVPGEKSGPPGPNAIVGARFAQDAVRRRSPTNGCQKCGAWLGCLGLEPTPEMYVQHLVEIFREVKRVLRKDGTLWLNLGDSYAGGGRGGLGQCGKGSLEESRYNAGCKIGLPTGKIEGLKPKDLVGIPWRVALALQADGWWLRSDIVWCLAGETDIFALLNDAPVRCQLRDLARLKKAEIYFPNKDGRWIKVKQIQKIGKSPCKSILFRNGVRIKATDEHKWPIGSLLKTTAELKAGDVINKSKPFPHLDFGDFTDHELGWFVGMFLAEGSWSEDTAQFALHKNELDYENRISNTAFKYGGTSFHFILGNNRSVHINGHIITSVLKQYIGGRRACGKHLARTVWQTNKEFIRGIVSGWLDGDAHYDKPNNRWRIGFTVNRELEADLRVACNILGWQIRTTTVNVKGFGKIHRAIRGEIRKEISSHCNNKANTEIIQIRNVYEDVYEIEIEAPDGLFALPGRILTHNSKPNPTPESVAGSAWVRHKIKIKNIGREQARLKRHFQNHSGNQIFSDAQWQDCPGCPKCSPNNGYVLRMLAGRPTRSHEYIFLLTKSERYFFDQEAAREPQTKGSFDRWGGGGERKPGTKAFVRTGKPTDYIPEGLLPGGRNIRSVWTITTKPFKEAHFATFPPELPERCIKAGTSEKGVCPECGAPWVRIINQSTSFEGGSGKAGKTAEEVNASGKWVGKQYGENIKLGPVLHTQTVGWKPSCVCNAGEPNPAIVFDPFAGAGTTGMIAKQLGRNYILIDIKPEYCEMAKKRIAKVAFQKALI